MKKTITATFVSLPLVLTAGFANAIPVQGSGNAYFANHDSCDKPGSSRKCRIRDKSANGSNAQVTTTKLRYAVVDGAGSGAVPVDSIPTVRSVSEPASLALFSLGLMGLGLAARHRRKA